MSLREYNVAIIGCGRIAGHNARAILATSGLKLVAICDLIEANAKEYSDEFSVPNYLNYHQMFKMHPSIDAVVIATPSGMHFEHTMEVLTKYKKHVIVEKPTFLTTTRLNRAYDTAERLGLKIFPVFQNRFNLAVQKVKNAIDSGELGNIQIMSVRVRWCRPQRYYDLSQWRGTYSHDGGALTNQGIHHVDLLRYLGGEVEKVNATMRTLGVNIEVEDSVVATLSYKTGNIASLEVTTAARPLDFEASISIIGSEGLAQIGGIAVNELQVFTPDPEACKIYSEDFSGCVYGNGHQLLYRSIHNSLSTQEPYLIDRSDCHQTINLLHAFYCSDEQSNWIQVSEGRESTRLGRPDERISNLYRTEDLLCLN